MSIFLMGGRANAAGASAAAELRRPSTYGVPGAFGPLRLGGGIGLSAPDGLSVAVATRTRYFGCGARAAYLPLVSLPGVDAELARNTVSGDLRAFPFGGAFFVGGVLGHARTLGVVSRSISVGDYPTRARAQLFTSSMFVGPEAGFQFALPLGRSAQAPQLTIGFEVGVAFPLSPGQPWVAVSAYGLNRSVGGEDPGAAALRSLARSPVPWIDVLKVGVLL